MIDIVNYTIKILLIFLITSIMLLIVFANGTVVMLIIAKDVSALFLESGQSQLEHKRYNSYLSWRI